MLKSDSFVERIERMLQLAFRSMYSFLFAYLSPLGWPCIYSVYRSQFEGCQASLLLDEIFLAFIQGDIKESRY